MPGTYLSCQSLTCDVENCVSVCERNQPQWGESCYCGLCFLVNCNSLDRGLLLRLLLKERRPWWQQFFWKVSYDTGAAEVPDMITICSSSIFVYSYFVHMYSIVHYCHPRISFGFRLKLVFQAATAMVVSEVKEIARSLWGSCREVMPRCKQADNQKLGSLLDFPGVFPCDLGGSPLRTWGFMTN